MIAEQPRKRALRARRAACRRRPLVRQALPRARRERPIFNRQRNRRTAVRLCAFATALLIAGAVSFSLLTSSRAAADVHSEERAAQDVAALQADPSPMPRAASFDVPALQQDPELPTGCESVALTNALLSLGFELDKTEIADAWLPRSDSDFVTAFMGDPHATDGHSCMAPAIVQTANAYLSAQGSPLEAFDLTGSTIEGVLDEVAAGNPVIVWCTIGLESPGDAYRVEQANGRVYRLYPNSHCVVVSGYDLHEGTALISDSLVGKTKCSLQQLTARYYELGAQAVVIK